MNDETTPLDLSFFYATCSVIALAGICIAALHFA